MVLITGGTGLVGSHLAFELVNRGHRVKIICNAFERKENVFLLFYYYSPSTAQALYDNLIWVEVDLLNAYSLTDALEGVDIVYHTSEYGIYSDKEGKSYKSKHIISTGHIIDRCLEMGIQHFCYVGTAFCLSNIATNLAIDESGFFKPGKGSDNFIVGKFFGELDVWRGVYEGLNAVVVEPSQIVGPDISSWKNGSFSGQLFRKKWGFISGSLGIVDVRDLVHCMIELMKESHKGQRFIVSGENIAFQDLVHKLHTPGTKIATGNSLPIFMQSFLWRLYVLFHTIFPFKYPISSDFKRIAFKNALFSNEKIKKYLNFEFRPIDETINELGRFNDFYSSNCHSV